MNNLKWSLSQVWNNSLEKKEDRPLIPRDNIWASELGGSYIDRYYKMKGIAYTNPPNMRSLRKFEAGNVWEWIIQIILKRAGILLDSQEHLEFQYPGLLKVTGRLDHLAGGKPNWEKAKSEMENLGLPDIIRRATNDIIEYLSTEYPLGLETLVLEVKSVSSYMFESYLATNTPNPNHELQLFHYLKSKGLKEGHLIYICKDDCRMLEFGVFNPSRIEELYKNDIEKMTKIIREDIEPEKEQLITFENKFNSNWKVAYSPYLTKIYGFKDQMEYEEMFRPLASKWNRVLKRVINGDKMTKLNLEVIDEIKRAYPNFDELVEISKNKNLDLSDESDE